MLIIDGHRGWGRTAVIIAGLMLSWVLSLSRLPATAQSNKSIPAPRPAARKPADAELAKKNPDELAHYVFENHGCKNCHTIGGGGKLGFTEHGKEIGKDFEGCISLLTSMNVIAQTKKANWTAQDRRKAERFHEFGCSDCHQVTPGKLGLTAYGAKLKSLHMACTDVEKVLASNKQ